MAALGCLSLYIFRETDKSGATPILWGFLLCRTNSIPGHVPGHVVLRAPPCARAASQSLILKTQPHAFSDFLKSAFLMTMPSHFFLSFHKFEGQRSYFSAQVLDTSVSLPVLPSSRPEKVKSTPCFLHSGTPPVQHGPVSRKRSPLPLCPQSRARARWAA